MREVYLIAALSKRTRAIGKEGRLLWHLPGDLPRFKRLTTGNVVVVGRHTWLSLPVKPLPGRVTIVITSAAWFMPPGVHVARSVEHALEIADRVANGKKIFFSGGSRVYADALPYATELLLTEVDSDADGDAHFPDYAEFSKVIAEEEPIPGHEPKFMYRTLAR